MKFSWRYLSVLERRPLLVDNIRGCEEHVRPNMSVFVVYDLVSAALHLKPVYCGTQHLIPDLSTLASTRYYPDPISWALWRRIATNSEASLSKDRSFVHTQHGTILAKRRMVEVLWTMREDSFSGLHWSDTALCVLRRRTRCRTVIQYVNVGDPFLYSIVSWKSGHC